ncbi:cupin [Aureimonas endophytica]|uniref:Cupin n=1 Tax=Aureimonas endophytica TaxID=2027858 RepID=A0A917A284_9HYPH|nr:AraC family transcriptional regulator [Aureimonas endophytica]GGE22983.1 cupin [Aureimonas endophytica]
MLDRSSNSAGPDAADPLSDMLRGLRLEGVSYARCRLAAPWGFGFSAPAEARFHFVAERGCHLLTPGGEWLELGAGDAVLLPRGGDYALASRPSCPCQPFPRWECRPICDNIYDLETGGAGEVSVLFFGSMRFNFDALHPLLRMMPVVMRAQELMRHEPAIPHLLEAMGAEVAMNRVGAGGILARLADVLAAQIIRSWVEHGCGDSSGWIAAVRNPEIGRVLAAIHADPARDWPLADLARLMGASRSSFVEKFTSMVGETPARYVAQVRMHQARQWLLHDRLRVSEIALRLGYDSEASFSRAFKRVVGLPPSRVRPAASA